MATIEQRTPDAVGDDGAIAELQEIVERQRAAFLADPFPSLQERQGLLGALAGMLIANRTQIQQALSSDFGVHPSIAADLIEVLGPAGRAVFAAEQLERPSRRCMARGAPSSSPSRRASSATSFHGTSPSTSPSVR